MKSALILILIISFPLIVLGQNKKFKVSGKILDSISLEELPFANIQIVGTNRGVTTDDKGDFSISDIGQSTQLLVSYVGYRSLQINLSESDLSSRLFIKLEPINIHLQEVTVYSNSALKADQIQSSNLSIQSERIREIAAGMPDILRSMQSLPGITANNEFKADFNVRGGNQDENLVLVNGTQVYEPYHIKEVPNASVGILNVDLMKKVDIITGGFPARYGDKMSSVLNIEYREGDREKYSGAGSLSLAYLDGYIEGPINENSSFIFGARKSYMEYVLSMIDYEDISTMKPSFYDIQGGISYSISPKNKLIFEFINAGDDFEYDPERIYSRKTEKEINRASYFSTLLDIKSKNIISSKALLDFEIAYYDQIDEENRIFDREQAVNNNLYDHLTTNRITYDSLRIKTFEFKTDLQYQLNSKYEFQTGLNYQLIEYEQDASDLWTYIGDRKNTDPIEKDTLERRGTYGTEIPITVDSYKYGAYFENIISPTQELTFNVGGRLDYFDINKQITFSPRVNGAYQFQDGTTLKAAWGHYYQSPIYDQLAYSTASDTNTQSQKAIHYILGIERKFNLSEKDFFKLKIETYYKEYDQLISSFFGVFERLNYSRENDAVGSSSGFDVYALLNYGDFYGWVSYGYLVAEEDKLDDNFGTYPRYTNQTHTIALVTNFKLGNNWDLSLKANYGSGFPYTPKVAVQDPSTGLWDWEDGEIHSEDLPEYKRIDIRISKLFIYDSFQLDTFLDISNVLNFRNIHRFEFGDPGFTKPVVEEVELWPILPSFGIRVKF